jgi:hypothetical protein
MGRGEEVELSLDQQELWKHRNVGIHAQCYEGGWEVFGFIKKTTSYGIKKMYVLYIFPPELHTFMTWLF